MEELLSSPEAKVLAYQIGAARSDISNLEAAVGKMTDVLVVLTRVEQRQLEQHETIGRVFAQIDKIVDRAEAATAEIAKIHSDLGPLQESRKWFVRALLLVATAVLTAAMSGLLHLPAVLR